ncbi:MAG: hypothetical protein QOD84_1209 [Acidobacteriaceae bacterium]|jgi:hypothetical protein
MRSLHFLYSAYAATWVIHLSYIVILLRMYARLRKQSGELATASDRTKFK